MNGNPVSEDTFAMPPSRSIISETVCMNDSYAFRNFPASGKVTNFVMDRTLIPLHNATMLDHEDIRDELIRQLDSGQMKAITVANALGIAKPRIVEMRKRERRVQQHEMQPLARLLGLQTTQAETVQMTVALPSEEALTQMFDGLFELVDRADLVDELAPLLAQHFPTALRQTLARISAVNPVDSLSHALVVEPSSKDRPVRQ